MAKQTIWVCKSTITGWFWAWYEKPQFRVEPSGRVTHISLVDWGGDSDELVEKFGKDAFEEVRDFKNDNIPRMVVVGDLEKGGVVGER